MVTLAHFSDVHLSSPRLGWRVRDWFGKRTSGWVSVRYLGRGRRFRHADDVVDALMRDIVQRRPDRIVFSGDATMMGFGAEIRAAAARLRVDDTATPPGVAVPGNHDLYTHSAARSRAFEEAFATWQVGERVDETHTYPFARKAGHVWLIGLNSAKPNLLSWDARGKVGAAQLDRFRKLCDSLSPGPRVVVSHYPLLTPDRQPEPRWHRLTDFAAVRDAAAECGVCLWLHGHRHGWYVLPVGPGQPFHSVGVGSSAQTSLWGYHEYTIDGWKLSAQRRVYDPDAGRFADRETFELILSERGASAP